MEYQYHDFEKVDLEEKGIIISSITRINDSILFLNRLLEENKIVVSGPLRNKFEGKTINYDGGKAVLANIDHNNLDVLRSVVDFTSPRATNENDKVIIISSIYLNKDKELFSLLKKYHVFPIFIAESDNSEMLLDMLTYKVFKYHFTNGFGIYSNNTSSTITKVDVLNKTVEDVSEISDNQHVYLNHDFEIGNQVFSYTEEELFELQKKYDNTIDNINNLIVTNEQQNILIKINNKMSIKQKYYLFNELNDYECNNLIIDSKYQKETMGRIEYQEELINEDISILNTIDSKSNRLMITVNFENAILRNNYFIYRIDGTSYQTMVNLLLNYDIPLLIEVINYSFKMINMIQSNKVYNIDVDLNELSVKVLTKLLKSDEWQMVLKVAKYYIDNAKDENGKILYRNRIEKIFNEHYDEFLDNQIKEIEKILINI